MTKRGYLLEDFRLFHLSEAPETPIVPHYHEFHKLLFLFSGTGGYHIEGAAYTVSSGDVLAVASHKLHQPQFSAPYERVILYLSPEFLEKASIRDCDLADLFSPASSPLLHCAENLQLELKTRLAALERELSSGEFGSVLAAQGLLLELLVFLIRCQRNAPPAQVPTDDPRILELLQYIDAHLSQPMTTDQLAEQFFISKYHLMHLFRQETGRTLHNYILERRLHLSKALMADGMNATTACYQSGFQSYCAFTRAYQKFFGSSPTGRRRTMLPTEETYE